ncbi:methyl-accepting chemotaxis protein [Lysinibacillus cavernae]|uniref:methyl-accepting chemotaxis protein n=1 Tax=Lysinibacillus cavernae TaxID=2666135 RepID=UPI0012D90414|nr:methyl-accepting chemotaxis protein [Lysinibacillus cavernae]
MHPKLQAVIESIDLYQATYPEDTCVIVADTEKVLAYKPGKRVDLKVGVGETVHKYRGTATEIALSSGRFVKEERGAEGFGMAYIASAQPIFDGGHVIGVVSAIISNEKMDNMRLLATELSSTVEEMTATNEGLATSSADVSNRLAELSNFSESMAGDIEQINVIVNIVKDLAMKSKILGLNASIEAARSGEHGRGFAVVASEIQKMSQSSSESAESITKQLENIKQSIDQVNASANQIAAFTQQFATSMHELTDAYKGVNSTAEKLLHISEIKE